VLQRSDTAGA